MVESYILHFPESNEVHPDTYSTAVIAYRQLIESIISNRTIVDLIGTEDAETMQVHTADLGEGMTRTVDDSSVIFTFENPTNILLQEALSSIELSEEDENPAIRISGDGSEVNDIPVKILAALGDPSRQVAREFRAIMNVATEVTEKMLLNPDEFISWMTALDPTARELPQFVALLNSIVDFGIKTLPINASIISKLVANQGIYGNEAVAFKHDILELNEEDSEQEGTPYMGEIYTMELIADQGDMEVKGKTVKKNSVKITHRVAAMYQNPEDAASKIQGQIGDRKKIQDPERVSELVNEWGPDSIISSAVVYFNLNTQDASHISVRHADRANTSLSINIGTKVYGISYFDKDGNYRVKINDATGQDITVDQIDAKDKVMIAKLLVSAPDYLISAADDNSTAV